MNWERRTEPKMNGRAVVSLKMSYYFIRADIYISSLRPEN